MVFREDVIVRINYEEVNKDVLKKVEERFETINGTAVKITENWQKSFSKLTKTGLPNMAGKWKKASETIEPITDQGKAISEIFGQAGIDIVKPTKSLIRGTTGVTTSTRRMTGALLGTGFFGAYLERIFKGLTSASIEWMGVSDVLTAFLGTTFLPIGQMFLDLVLWLWDAYEKLPQPVKNFISVLVLLAGVFATLIGSLAFIKLGLVALGMVFGPLIAAGFGPIIAIIAAVIAILVILWYAWSNNLGNIQEKTAVVFNAIKNVIELVINGIKFLIQSALDFVKAIWEGRWGDALNIVQNVFENIKTFLGGVFTWIIDSFSKCLNSVVEGIKGIGSSIYNAAVGLLNSFIDGIRSMASSVRDAFWNILPNWIQNAIRGVGAFASSILRAFGGLFGMQAGGIVTRPTAALIGERGPEAVIPLDRIGSIGGINITINTSTIGGNTDALAREIAEKFAFELGRVRY